MRRHLAPVLLILAATTALLAGCGPHRYVEPVASEYAVDPIVAVEPVFVPLPVVVNGPTIVRRTTVIAPRPRVVFRPAPVYRSRVYRSGFGTSFRSSRRR